MEQNQIVIYQTEDGQTQIDVRLEDETVWLTQAQMMKLFKSSRTNILEHIQHIYEDEELDQISTCRKFRQVQKEGNRMVNRTKTMYNLDMIISVGYRVNTKRGIKFRQWANRILKEYLIKGYVINERIRKEQIGELRPQKLSISRSQYYLPASRAPLKRPFLGVFVRWRFSRHKVGLSSGETPTFPVINSELAGRSIWGDLYALSFCKNFIIFKSARQR